MKTLRLHDAAAAEFLAAILWYRERSTEVARRFRHMVRAAIHSLHEAPSRWPRAPGVPSSLGVRRYVVDKFPFSVFYMELDAEIVVIAVAHAKRRPGYWAERVITQATRL